MRRFSIGTSLGDAFALIRRRPVAVFVWGLLMVAPIALMLAFALPAISALIGDPAFGEAETPEAFAPDMVMHMMQFQLASMVGNIGQLLAAVVIYTAVMRAVLHPGEASYLSLRVGMDELRIAVVGLAIGVGFYAVMMVVVMLGVGIAFLALGIQGEGPSGVALVVAAVFGVFAVGAMVWGLARVSMIAPATVLRKDFAFPEGWRIASGQGWALLGLLVVALLVVIVIELVLFLIVLGGVLVAVNAGLDWSVPVGADPTTIVQDWLAAHWYWAALGAVVLSLFYGLVSVVTVAPFASACRQLVESGPREDASPEPAA